MIINFQIIIQLLVFGLTWGALFALTANGLNLVFGVTRILNVAHGEFLMLGAYIAFWLFSIFGLGPAVSVFVSAVLLFLFGTLIQTIIVRPIIKADPSIEKVEKATLIVFFGVLLFLQNSALILWTADYRIVTYLEEPIHLWGISISTNKVIVFFVALVVCLLLQLFMKGTFIGKAIRAISEDREAGAMLGINPNSIGLLSFGLGAALAGIGGSLVGMVYVITPTMGLIFTVKSFIVMVLGGLGNVTGTLYAGIFLGILESLGSFFLGEAYKEVLDYIVLSIFILLFSKGYIRRKGVI